jgi:hypothetical protein
MYLSRIKPYEVNQVTMLYVNLIKFRFLFSKFF